MTNVELLDNTHNGTRESIGQNTAPQRTTFGLLASAPEIVSLRKRLENLVQSCLESFSFALAVDQFDIGNIFFLHAGPQTFG